MIQKSHEEYEINLFQTKKNEENKILNHGKKFEFPQKKSLSFV